MKWRKQDIIQTLNSQKTPHIVPLWVNYACPLQEIYRIQSCAVKTRSNITWYCTQHSGTEAEYQSKAEPTKDTPYLALTGELWGVFRELFGENWPHYGGTALYWPYHNCTTLYIFVLPQINSAWQKRLRLHIIYLHVPGKGSILLCPSHRFLPHTWRSCPSIPHHSHHSLQNNTSQWRHNRRLKSPASWLFT